MRVQELAELKVASAGTIADKIRYFDNCVRRRLQELHIAQPAASTPFSWEQKRKLSLACSQLDEAHCAKLIDIVAKHVPKDVSADADILIDINSLSDAALWEMQVSHAALRCTRVSLPSRMLHYGHFSFKGLMFLLHAR